MSAIHVTTDGDTLWLQCFADNADAEHGEIVTPVEPGDSWDELAAKVAEHQAGHGCASAVPNDPARGRA